MWIRLSNTDVLPLKEEDVHRVYELPMAGEQINPKLCSEAAIGRLRVELGLDANNAAIVNVKELEKRMDIIENPTAWVKGAICLIIHNILCPTNRSSVYLHYAEVLENASTYNWCSYVLQYMKDGLQNPKVANPLADFHFLMINNMEKMGKKSPFLTGIYKRPSLRDWDVKMANQDLQKVHELMGLDNGLTYGVKRLHSTEDGPLVMCFDADTCPLSKAEEHLNYCRGAIRVYTTAAETLQRRIVEGSVGTSRENDLVQNQSKKAEENKRSNNEKEKAEKDSSIPQTITQEEESKGANLDNDNVAEDDINAKSVDKDDDDNEDDETNAKGIDEDDKEDEINSKGIDEDDNAERIDEDDDEEEIIAKMIDDSVKAACKIIDDSVKTSSNVQDEMNANSMKQPSNAGLTLTQETILKFPEYLGDVNEEIKTNDSETPGLSATQETMLKFPEYFDNDSTKEKCSQSLALMLVPEAKGGEKPTECNEEIVLDATPLRSAFPDEIIDLDNKQLSTYAWSPELDPHDLLYCSDNKAHQYALERQALWSLQQDEWVSCLVINAWVNCLNWNQPRDKMKRLVTPMMNYVDLERPGAFDKNNPAAFARFIDRLSKFKYIDWKDMDPNSLELIMTPAIIGKPGNHYVCFVVNLKRQKYEFLNSLTGDTLYNKNGTATVYKDMLDVLLNEQKKHHEKKLQKLAK
ncbi:1-aminocyclopropane-1-carboxylate synthase [Trifolium repens]|nr:1-aminocyclopropane-1-carboxylate synthase [Trifolium repens]